MNNDENVERSSSDTTNSRHKRVRDQAEVDYLRSIATGCRKSFATFQKSLFFSSKKIEKE